jgi:hypothetical protein
MEILNFCEHAPGSHTVAIFSVYIPESQLTIHKMRLIRSKKGVLFLTLPSYRSEQTDPTQKPVYLPYFQFSQEKREKDSIRKLCRL